MKKPMFFLLLVITLCNSNIIYTKAQTTRDFLVDQWRWIGTSGGYAGFRFYPSAGNTKSCTFSAIAGSTDSLSYSFYRNDTLIERGSVKLSYSNTVVGYSFILKGDSGFFRDEKVLLIKENNTIEFADNAYDAYFYRYKRKDKSTESFISDTTCKSYNSPSSKYSWTLTGTYLDTIPNAAGYDSIITVILTIVSIDTSVTQVGNSLSANEEGGSYQWTASDTIIKGATDRNYTPLVTGAYLVEITKNGCMATSSSYHVLINKEGTFYESVLNASVSVYPNPVSDMFIISLDQPYDVISIDVNDISGRTISHELFRNQNSIQLDMGNYKSGCYFINVKRGGKEMTFKILKI